MRKITTLICIMLTALRATAQEPSAFSRTAVVEELTGTWCAWCIYGMVNMETAMQEYGDRLIAISVHGGNDVMKDDLYCAAVEKLGGFISYPNAIINRDRAHKGYPQADFFAQLPDILATEAPAALHLTATISPDSTEATLSTEVIFSRDADQEGWHLAYILVEDSVHQPDDKAYSQRNGYAGGGSGPMGGYEEKPAVVPPEEMYYRNVARCFFDDFNGTAASLPASITAGETIRHEIAVSLPQNVLVPANCRAVVMLLDAENHVAQAAQASWTEPPTIPTAIGISATDGTHGIPPRCLWTYGSVRIMRMPDGTIRKVTN